MYDAGTSKPKKVCKQGQEVSVGPQIKQTTFI